ncbi:tRNA dihydrouridine synthase DusB [Wenzhouxiangella sp. XN79A]|uniref:tRNA dihydrouridine synthase DusB n=1 Tax=Wenzhouxiangella sp. XN79A TaxID=2724193 RepID=UPI00144A95F2|nr:tRNA dihydrouridine synthase DusB [Wenzhouxiangella sp. XN79A]NKI36098.1 tRNA dihydrouridine synthase DusB [Wenzhouxiangella sp. XN79A]
MTVPVLRIGRHEIAPALGLAPMAGVTDKPFRLLCRRMGAGLATTEMTSANPQLRGSRKSAERLDHAGEPGPISVQIAGTEPDQMAEFARYNVDHGAEIIDINMGCPAKKVCRAWAGSALMRDEALVAAILTAVVDAVDVPVTLKIRTGWAADRKNAPVIARIAEDAGIAALAIHGRTRDQKYQGTAEYDTIARIKQDLSIPIWANGDVDDPDKARRVLEHTRADGLLIGRAAQGRPWIFEEIRHYLDTGEHLPDKSPEQVGAILVEHLEALHAFYGAERGVRIARKHLGWYVKAHPGREAFLASINRVNDAAEQVRRTREYFEGLAAVLGSAA